MPSTPIYNIDYPCVGAPVTLADFFALATDTEAAITATYAEAAAVSSDPMARALGSTAAPLAVDTILTYTAFPSQNRVSGITLNAAAGTFTIVTPGVYVAYAAVQGNQSTLTMTSQRVAVYLNGGFYAGRKYRGYNPTLSIALTGTYSIDVGYLAVGDVITFRYIWTGTGALTANAQAIVGLDYITS